MPDSIEDLQEKIAKAQEANRAAQEKERRELAAATEKHERELLQAELKRLTGEDPNEPPVLHATETPAIDPPADTDKKDGNK